MSAFTKATGDVVCPTCGAANRPGATYCEKQQDGTYLCIVCAKSWTPTP